MPMTYRLRRSAGRATICVASALAGLAASAIAAAAAAPPEIRTGPSNQVPACVTPDRLMQYMQRRNARLDPAFRDIASQYKRHGEAWHVRWDYAFFQMLVETNFLTYRTGAGRWGDVNPRQNNFAGIGTTGGGVPGNGFPDVSTGVLAQIHHLVVYSGERVADPVAPRTRLKMDEILQKSHALGRPVTFDDLKGRWAVDRQYGNSIEWAAKGFRDAFCGGSGEAAGGARGQRRAAR